MTLQARPEVRPLITQSVVATIGKVGDETAFGSEITALLNYVQHIFIMRNVMKVRKQWDDDRHAKIDVAIANAMKQWDDDHYPRLLEATWGWHPFYPSFVANPLCSSFRPTYPLLHSVVEGLGVHGQLLQHSHVERVYPVPWSLLLIRCFLKFHTISLPLISHPFTGGSIANVTRWLKLAHEDEGDGWRAWHYAKMYLKDEGFLLFAGARVVDTKQQWHAEVDDVCMELKNPSPGWWTKLRVWCQTTQFRVVQDMAFHDKASWLNAWVIRDQPVTFVPPLAGYDRWLQHREELDIGFVLANPGHFLGPLSELNLKFVTTWLHLCNNPSVCPCPRRYHGALAGA